MEFEYFDDLARRFATGALSRRQVLKNFLAGMVGATVAGPWLASKPQAAPAECDLASNVFCGTCEDFRQYVQNTGVLCADGNPKVGYSGCATFQIKIVSRDEGKIKYDKDKASKLECAYANVTVVFDMPTEIRTMTFIPKPEPCCLTTCQNEIKRWADELIAHEQLHVADAERIEQQANQQWTQKLITTSYPFCGETKAEADRFLKVAIDTEIANTQIWMKEEFEKRDIIFPLPFTLVCGKCSPPAASNEMPMCCNDTCVDLYNDNDNCGSCGTVCPAGTSCDHGQCLPDCPRCEKRYDGVCRPCQASQCDFCVDGECKDLGRCTDGSNVWCCSNRFCGPSPGMCCPQPLCNGSCCESFGQVCCGNVCCSP